MKIAKRGQRCIALSFGFISGDESDRGPAKAKCSNKCQGRVVPGMVGKNGVGQTHEGVHVRITNPRKTLKRATESLANAPEDDAARQVGDRSATEALDTSTAEQRREIVDRRVAFDEQRIAICPKGQQLLRSDQALKGSIDLSRAFPAVPRVTQQLDGTNSG